MAAIVCVMGSFMMDLVAYVDRRPAPGETLLGKDFETFLGGKGFNQAVAARRAGSTVQMIGCLGDDAFGNQFLEALDQEQIGRVGTSAISGAGTGVGLPVVDQTGSNSIIIIPKANLLVDVNYVNSQEEIIASSDVLLLQLELPLDSAVRAAQIAKSHGVKVVLNPAPMGDITVFYNLIDVLVPNEVEFNSLIGPDRNFKAGIQYFEDRFPGIDLVITLGKDGACLVNSGTEIYTPAKEVEAVDTTGAGDVFCGYLAAVLASGQSLATAVELSVAASGISVLSRGAAFSSPFLLDAINSI
jgi:ribokinase